MFYDNLGRIAITNISFKLDKNSETRTSIFDVCYLTVDQ